MEGNIAPKELGWAPLTGKLQISKGSPTFKKVEQTQGRG
jgi:hypothetical protein